MKREPWPDLQARLHQALEALDWQRLGELYFHEDGEQLLRARRSAITDLGLRWAKAEVKRLPAGGRSLYAGAGLAELPAMLAEVLIADREVRAANLRAEECELLAAGTRAAGVAKKVVFECCDAGELASAGSFDHLVAVCLFTDPETWPMLSDVTYGRIAPVQVDVEQFVAEREQARALAARLWAGLRLPGWLTTTAEEVSWFLELAAAAGVDLEAEEELIETSIVGDPVGFLRVGPKT